MSVSILIAGLTAWAGDSEIHPNGANAYQNVTGEDSEGDRLHWDSIYNTTAYVYGKEPAAFLREHISLLRVGKALDIAMGEGRNAVYLAKKGFRVTGVDISEVALSKARRLAKDNRVVIKTVNSDLSEYVIKPDSFDVIVDIDYLQRSLIPQIRRGVKKGGLVVFEANTTEQLRNPGGKTLSKQWLLKKGELREFFKDFEILVYRETNDGKDARASIVARRPQ